MLKLLANESELVAGVFISHLLAWTLFMYCSTLNKLPFCLFPDKSCLDGNRDPASPALTGCRCTSLGKDEATQTTFIPLVNVKKTKAVLDTN